MPINQTIEIVWHPMTERPTRFDSYLVAEANCRFKDGQTLVHYDVNERSFCRRLLTHGQSGTPYAWAEKPKIEVPKQEELCATSAHYEKSLGSLKYFKWWLKWYERWMKRAEQFKEG